MTASLQIPSRETLMILEDEKSFIKEQFYAL